MAHVATDPKQQAHTLIDRISNGQAFAVVGLLEAMLDPVSVALAHAPLDTEEVSDEEARDIAGGRAAYARGEALSNDDVLSEFGLSPDHFNRTETAPQKPESRYSGH